MIKKKLNNQTIGFIMYSLENDEIYIFMLGLDQPFQRKGYGSEVVDLMKTKASTIKLNCVSGDGEDEAIAFWTSQGFRLNPQEDIVDNLAFVYP